MGDLNLRTLTIYLFQNHLRLAYEIVCGEHGEIEGNYSAAMKELVNSMLQKVSKI